MSNHCGQCPFDTLQNLQNTMWFHPVMGPVGLCQGDSGSHDGLDFSPCLTNHGCMVDVSGLSRSLVPTLHTQFAFFPGQSRWGPGRKGCGGETGSWEQMVAGTWVGCSAHAPTQLISKMCTVGDNLCGSYKCQRLN